MRCKQTATETNRRARILLISVRLATLCDISSVTQYILRPTQLFRIQPLPYVTTRLALNQVKSIHFSILLWSPKTIIGSKTKLTRIKIGQHEIILCCLSCCLVYIVLSWRYLVVIKVTEQIWGCPPCATGTYTHAHMSLRSVMSTEALKRCMRAVSCEGR